MRSSPKGLTAMVQDAAGSAIEAAVAEDTARLEEFRRPEMGAVNVGDDPFGDRPMPIGEVARVFSVTLRALRFYEAKRLINPQRHGATRLYRRSDRERLRLILTGQRLGFTLAEIKELLGRADGKTLQLTREQCVTQINLLEQRKRGIEIAIAELRQICTSFYVRLLETTDE